MKFIITLIPCFIFAWILGGCNGQQKDLISYPEPLPDSIPLKFLPGVVTSTELDFNSAFSPDGKSFYFCRSKNRKWMMYVTRYDGKKWTMPIRPSFNDTTYAEADPAFSEDGTLYFISNRPKNANDTIKDYDIWFVKPLGDNKWSEPINLAIVNSDSDELYISVSANRNLYFSSSRPGGFGQEDIYFCKYENNEYVLPVNLGNSINSPGSDHDPLIIKDENLLIFTSSDRTDSYGQADLYYSTRTSELIWGPAENLGSRFNTPTYEYCSYLSPDGKYFFYSTDSDVKWIRSDYLFNVIQTRTIK